MTGSRSALLPLGLAAGMIVFGSATPVSKLVTDAMPVFVAAGLRVAIGALALAPFVRDWGQLRDMDRAEWGRVALIAVFGMFGFTVLLLWGMRSVSGVTGSIVMATTPAVTAAAAVLFLGDSLNWRKTGALACAVAGVVVLRLPDLGDGGPGGGAVTALVGMALVFGAVCCEAVYTLVGRSLSRGRDPILVAFLAAALSLPLFVPFALAEARGFDPTAVAAADWAALLWYGAGTLALGSWLWYASIRRTSGTVAAAFMGLMPVSALILSYVLLGEPFVPLHLLGFGIVFAGVLLMSWEHARMGDD